MQGHHTHEQFKRIIHGDVNTKNGRDDIKVPDQAKEQNTLAPAKFDMETGDRSIKRGTNQEGEHHKRRVDD